MSVTKKMLSAYVKDEVIVKIPALIAHYGAPSISRLIEGMLEVFIEEMEAENAKISNRNVQSIR